MTTTYYNEWDRFPAAWLRNLIAAGHLPEGEVDETDIRELAPSRVAGARHAHFFAGIGGWPLAMQLAGWPDDLPLWTGSCPCQPFSAAGKQRGEADERHLWPAFRRIIAECQPPICVGEQVASAAGREWLAGVRADLEDLGYEVGAADLCAPGVGAPHLRQRLYWVAVSKGEGRPGMEPRRTANERERAWAGGDGATHGLAVSQRWPAERQRLDVGGPADGPQRKAWERERLRHEPGPSGSTHGLSYDDHDGPHRPGRVAPEPDSDGPDRRLHWGSAAAILCRDGKYRRIPLEPALFPLADGVPNRVGVLRGSGNAIVPQLAAEFLGAVLDILGV